MPVSITEEQSVAGAGQSFINQKQASSVGQRPESRWMRNDIMKSFVPNDPACDPY